MKFYSTKKIFEQFKEKMPLIARKIQTTLTPLISRMPFGKAINKEQLRPILISAAVLMFLWSCFSTGGPSSSSFEKAISEQLPRFIEVGSISVDTHSGQAKGSYLASIAGAFKTTEDLLVRAPGADQVNFEAYNALENWRRRYEAEKKSDSPNAKSFLPLFEEEVDDFTVLSVKTKKGSKIKFRGKLAAEKYPDGYRFKVVNFHIEGAASSISEREGVFEDISILKNFFFFSDEFPPFGDTLDKFAYKNSGGSHKAEVSNSKGLQKVLVRLKKVLSENMAVKKQVLEQVDILRRKEQAALLSEVKPGTRFVGKCVAKTFGVIDPDIFSRALSSEPESGDDLWRAVEVRFLMSPDNGSGSRVMFKMQDAMDPFIWAEFEGAVVSEEGDVDGVNKWFPFSQCVVKGAQGVAELNEKRAIIRATKTGESKRRFSVSWGGEPGKITHPMEVGLGKELVIAIHRQSMFACSVEEGFLGLATTKFILQADPGVDVRKKGTVERVAGSSKTVPVQAGSLLSAVLPRPSTTNKSAKQEGEVGMAEAVSTLQTRPPAAGEVGSKLPGANREGVLTKGDSDTSPVSQPAARAPRSESGGAIAEGEKPAAKSLGEKSAKQEGKVGMAEAVSTLQTRPPAAGEVGSKLPGANREGVLTKGDSDTSPVSQPAARAPRSESGGAIAEGEKPAAKSLGESESGEKRLNSAYSLLRAKLSGADRDRLKAEQVKWIKAREGVTKEGTDLWNRMAAERAQELEALSAGKK